ncbi:single-stranded DNA-binding protein [Corynebacterium gerontici]|uniref:Single-stranded DNA-binding protein n=1 Tax=Corynebacterium gerontici TaxID=2079234 RepID=A0A3G6J2Z2_9CORY|nr:single-stranded DNA-binding protein [Corynebacterium gerontici]AZA12377.1 Single-stranded DNA-binding protein [Corynebacterium gerontici]
MAIGDVNITVVGNMVADPELRYGPSGAAVANFRIASTPRRYDSQSNQWVDGDALFLQCSVWRQAAENVAQTLTKGMRVIVTGRLKQRSYQTREGENRTVMELEVEEVGPSLKYATAQVDRNSREGGGNFGGQRSGQGSNQGGQGGQGGFGNQGNFGNQGGFGGQNAQGGFGGNNQGPVNDPWNSAPQQGGFAGDDSEPPF